MLVHTNASPIRPAHVLLLGAGGFLAPVLTATLERDEIAVRAIGSRDIDLTLEGAAKRLASEIHSDDALVMAAALTPDKGRDTATLMRNLRMGENVCAALAEAKPAHFVYISSDGVYDARFSALLNEESTCEPADLYCVMHIAREKMLLQTCRPAGVRLAIVRPSAIYGAGDTHNSYGPNRFIRTARKDRKITLFGGGEEKRHHVHVADVAQIIRLCLLYRSEGLINAVPGEAVSFADVAQIVASETGDDVIIERLQRSSPITHRHFDTSALARAFPDLIATSLREGLARTVAAVRAGESV
jgi:UDP-glucose 4-epimerase